MSYEKTKKKVKIEAQCLPIFSSVLLHKTGVGMRDLHDEVC